MTVLIRDQSYDGETPFYSSIGAVLRLLYKIGIDNETSNVTTNNALSFMVRMSNERVKKNGKKKSALRK